MTTKTINDSAYASTGYSLNGARYSYLTITANGVIGGVAGQPVWPTYPGRAGGTGVTIGFRADVTNLGDITGGRGGQGGAALNHYSSPGGVGGAGGVGILFAGGGTLDNEGYVTGGAAGRQEVKSFRKHSGSDGGAGVVLAAGGAVNNSGTIAGGTAYSGGAVAGAGVVVSGSGSGSVTNLGGFILGGSPQYQPYSAPIEGGDGVSFSVVGNLTNSAGVIAGGDGGGYGVRLTAGGTVSNSGTISGGVGITGHGAYEYDGVVNAISGGRGGDGLYLKVGGTVTSLGSISGGAGGIGGMGSYADSNPYSVFTPGGAGGLGGAGIYSRNGGTAFNTGAIAGGVGGMGGEGFPGAMGGKGGAGLDFLGQGSVDNGGTITGGTGGVGGAGVTNDAGFGSNSGGGGAGGSGIYFGGGGMVTNTGTIVGGAGAAGGVGATDASSGNQGSGVALWRGGGVLVNGSGTSNTASITGRIGVYTGPTGAATVTNFGTITGTSGTSVKFGSASDRLIVEAGSRFVGKVNGGGGTLELANGSGSITGLGVDAQLVGQEAVSFSAFKHLAIDQAASWFLDGFNRIGAGRSVYSVGSLSVTGTVTGAGTLWLGGGSADIVGAKLAVAQTVIDGATVTLSGRIANNGTISLNAGEIEIGDAGARLAGGGEVRLGGGVTGQVTSPVPGTALVNVDNLIEGGGDLGGGRLALTNAAAGQIIGDSVTALVIDDGGGTIQNAGKISARVGGGVEIRSAIDNTGLLVAAGGTLTLDAAVTGAGSAQIYSGEIVAAGAFNENVGFDGTAGTLELTQAYAGKITGFSHTGSTSLDLRAIGFVSATEATFSGTTAGGTLTVTDGTHTAKIALVGDYTGAAFVASSDGHGGTTVIDPAVHAFIAASAAIGAPAGASTALNPGTAPAPPLLAHPRG